MDKIVNEARKSDLQVGAELEMVKLGCLAFGVLILVTAVGSLITNAFFRPEVCSYEADVKVDLTRFNLPFPDAGHLGKTEVVIKGETFCRDQSLMMNAFRKAKEETG